MKLFLTSAFAFLLIVNAAAQTDMPRNQTVQSVDVSYTKTVNMRYLLFTPKGYGEEKKKWPLMVFHRPQGAIVEREGSIEAGCGIVIQSECAHPCAKFQGVITLDHRGVILELIVILVTDDGPLIVASTSKRASDVDCRISVDRVLAVVLSQVLKSCLVHDLGADHLGITDLKGVFRGNVVISL